MKHIRELEYEHFVFVEGKREYDNVGCVIENVMHIDDIGHMLKSKPWNFRN